MTDETTTEQLAEIEGQTAEPQPEPVPEPVQVREGRWRQRNGDIRNVTPTPSHDIRKERWPWRDAEVNRTWSEGGLNNIIGKSPLDLVEYLGPIEPEPQQVNDWPSVRDLRHELKTVQTQLGESRQRVTQLEELVSSLRTINEGAEKAVSGAGVVNDSLRLQLAAVKAELVTQAETSRRLQIELDAAQQVPTDSPEIRQLWANLAEVAHDRDTYKHAHELLVQDIDATHQRTKAETVEAIAEWLEPVRRLDPHLRAVVLFHLPKIIRSLAGLNTPEDVD